jgi:RNA polymerase sigma-70 factor (ECF subfamily)
LDFRQFDEAYLQGLCRGDPEVEHHFTSYFGQLILIKLRQRLRSLDAIEDVRQETFLRVFRILRTGPGVREPAKLGAFVNSICNNVFLEACRARRYEELPDELGPAASADALDRLISEEERRQVERVLADLPERDRRLLRTVFLDEASRDAVCAELQVDRDYLRVLLHRAKESFRARLAADEGTRSSGPPARPHLRST